MAARGWTLCFALLAAGCFGRPEATRETNQAWRGRSGAALEERWGPPAEAGVHGERTELRYARSRRVTVRKGKRKKKRERQERPPDRYGLNVFVEAGERAGDLVGEAKVKRPRRTRRTVLAAEALVTLDRDGRITEVAGDSLSWGPPNDENLRWGTILGMHVGLGALDSTATPLPSGGAYLGGMLSSRLGLVGTFGLASGRDDAGGAVALSWGIAPQYWLSTRLWARAGPALILAYDPGFQDPGLELGLTGGLSFAAVKAGTFVLDLRLDLSAGPGSAFGTAGVGVNLN